MKQITTILLALAIAIPTMAVPPRNPNAENRDPSLVVHRSNPLNDAQQVNQRKAIGVQKQFRRIPVILVNFSDLKFRIPRAQIDSMFNGQNYTQDGATGSVQRYFSDQSNGQYVPQFDIYGPITVSKSCTSYQGIHSLVTEACNLMDDSLDFKQYALIDKTQVDLVYVLYAGPPSSDADGIDPSWIKNAKSLIWPCKWNLANPIQKDGVTINDYEVSSELDGYFSNAQKAVIAGIGLACHEFSHGLGLPDTYQTSGNKLNIAKDWDIMCYGLYNNDVRTPPNYNAYQKWFMGWITPTLLNEASSDTLPEWSQSNKAYVITENGLMPSNILSPAPANFYLLENRQKIGWDAYLQGEGMLMTRVKYDASAWKNNTPNNNLSDPRLCFVPADGDYNTSGYIGKQSDLFPTATVDSYTPFTDYPISGIKKEANKDITFQFMGGAPIQTTIENVLQERLDNRPRKILYNGQLYIVVGGRYFNPLGQ